MLLNDRDTIIALTPKNPFDRFPDGRPRVPDTILERMKLVTLEETIGVNSKEDAAALEAYLAS